MAAPAQRAPSLRGARPLAPLHPAGCSRRVRRAVEDPTGSLASPGRSTWTDNGLMCALAHWTDSWTDHGTTLARTRRAASRPRIGALGPT